MYPQPAGIVFSVKKSDKYRIFPVPVLEKAMSLSGDGKLGIADKIDEQSGV